MSEETQTIRTNDAEPKQRYLEMLSHDLRSTMGNVIAGLELMNQQGLDEASKLHHFGALASARHVTHLIEGILDIRAIDSNDFSLNTERINLKEFLNEIYRTWLSAISAKKLSFDVRTIGKLPPEIELDHGRVLRILGNLIENAIKYTDEGKIVLTLEIKNTRDLTFTVIDDGPGFSDSARAKLFEFRGRPTDSHKPGTGLGLYIARSLVDNMGGSISAKNHRNGAQVTVSFALSTAEIAELERDGTVEGPVAVLPTAVLPDLSQMNILLAEDNATNRMVVTQMLDAMGANFTVSCDGAEAIEKFEDGCYNLALLDIEMPHLSGLEVIRHIRSSAPHVRGIPIVALTAYAMREHREKIFAAGADGLIAKPIMGIENFGHELLKHFRKSTGHTAQGDNDTSALPDADNVINMATFNSLEETVGSEKIDYLLGKIREDLQNVSAKISAGMANGDLKMVAAASHVLISVAGAIGAERVQAAGQMLNRAAHMNDPDQLDRQSAESLTGITDILSMIDKRPSC